MMLPSLLLCAMLGAAASAAPPSRGGQSTAGRGMATRGGANRGGRRGELRRTLVEEIDYKPPIQMQPLGAYCGGLAGGNASGCDETTPIMWHGALVMVERHSNFRVRRQAFGPLNQTDNNVMIDGVPGSAGIAFASAIVVENTLWIFGTNNNAAFGGKPRTQVHTFWSSDPPLAPDSWKHSIILQLPSNGTAPPGSYMVPWWTAFNTSPTKGELNGKETFVLAIELGSPASLIGHRFTSVFARCDVCASTGDLSGGWRIISPEQHIYRKDRYSACPTLRWYDGWFYLITLYEGVQNPRGPNCNSGVSQIAGRQSGNYGPCGPCGHNFRLCGRLYEMECMFG